MSRASTLSNSVEGGVLSKVNRHAARGRLAAERAHASKLGLEGHELDEAPSFVWRRAKAVLHLGGDLRDVRLVDRGREALVEREPHAHVAHVGVWQECLDVARELRVHLVPDLLPAELVYRLVEHLAEVVDA